MISLEERRVRISNRMNLPVPGQRVSRDSREFWISDLVRIGQEDFHVVQYDTWEIFEETLKRLGGVVFGQTERGQRNPNQPLAWTSGTREAFDEGRCGAAVIKRKIYKEKILRDIANINGIDFNDILWKKNKQILLRKSMNRVKGLNIGSI